MSFRAAYRSDLRLRALDAALHLSAALLLPGPWWLQYLPDAMLPLVWSRSWWRDRFLPDSDLTLQLHRVLHGSHPLWLAWMVVLSAAVLEAPQLVLHVLVHLSVDLLTHGKDWQ